MDNQSPRDEEKKPNLSMEEIRLLITVIAIFVMSFTIQIVKINNDAVAIEFDEIPKKTEISVQTDNIDETENITETKNIARSEKLKVTSKTEEDNPKEEISNVEENISYKKIDEIVEEISPEMDISEPSGISKDDFVLAMEKCDYDKNSVLADNAVLIWENCNERQINEFAIIGIIAIESGWANPEVSELTAEKNNIMSIRDDEGEYKTYYSYSECIEDAIRILDENYLEADGRYATGGNLQDISVVYAEDTNWANRVAECAEMSTRGLKQEDTKILSKEE